MQTVTSPIAEASTVGPWHVTGERDRGMVALDITAPVALDGMEHMALMIASG